MKAYVFSWRSVKEPKWNHEKNVVKHFYIAEADKLALEYVDGGVHEIPFWRECELKLGPDWKATQRKVIAGNMTHQVSVEVIKE